MKKTSVFLFLFITHIVTSQETFTRKDSLHGGLRFERTCYDVLLYDLEIGVDIGKKSIQGLNRIFIKTLENTNKIQLDLFENMQVDSILLINKSNFKKKLSYTREFNAVFLNFEETLPKDQETAIFFYYSGTPLVAKNAPWDGGFVWSNDKNGKPFVGVAVQGTGASLWFPCKDSQTDEPESGMMMSITVDTGLTAVSNGRLIKQEKLPNGKTTWIWQVKNPINNYNITLNIADYVHIHDNHKGLDLNYYVLSYNEEKAIKHFEEVKPMMDCFQSKFGEYPFKEDGYKLVETPYLGMEHQSAVAYGNRYLKGYRGSDLSGTGIGLTFDYITIHESGHEWFGNSITSTDIADMWIHEAFTMYSEVVYVECQLGYEKAQSYMNGMKMNVENDKPIIGKYGVNNEGSGDMYYKGALLINTIRHIINDETKWWKLLFDYSNTFKHKIIDTETVINYFTQETKIDLTSVFNQYLRYTTIPKLDLKIINGKLSCRWTEVDASFSMAVDVIINSKTVRINPKTEWTSTKIKIKNVNEVQVATDKFYILGE